MGAVEKNMENFIAINLFLILLLISGIYFYAKFEIREKNLQKIKIRGKILQNHKISYKL